MAQTEHIRIAIDGPAAAGKSTAAKGLAKALGVDYVDTGAMYRAIALKLIRNEVCFKDADALALMLGQTDVDFDSGHVLLDGEIVDELIRSPEVSRLASESSAELAIREKLGTLQRGIAAQKSVVMDGRDIGTHVLPDAEFKFFLTASVQVRAQRRALEMEAKGSAADLNTIEADIRARDERDSTRAHHPLAQADDAILIDSTELDAQDVVDRMMAHIFQQREVIMDYLYYNGTIRTMNDDRDVVQAIGIQDGRIAFVGTNEEAKSISATEKIDLEGKFVLPGFDDSHMHLLHYSFINRAFPLLGVNSLQKILENAKAYVAENQPWPEGKWLFGRGWNHEFFEDEKRFITRHDLDKISTDIPIIFIRVCGHIAAANSLATELMLAHPKAPGMMDKIEPENGLFKEAALKISYEIMAPPTQPEIEDMILYGVEHMNRAGLTTVQTDDFMSLPGKDWKTISAAYQNLEKQGKLNMRINNQASFATPGELKAFLDTGFYKEPKGDRFKIACIKIFQDGSLGARTALLREDYEGYPGERGIMMHDQDELNDMVSMAHDAGLPAVTHCIGDKAADMMIDAVEYALKKNPRPDHRHGIVHLQITDMNILERMKELGMTAMVQPVFSGYDMDIVADRVGKKRESTSYLWKTLIKMGIHSSGGSDAPVERFDVLENIQIGVTREKLTGGPENGWMPEERLSVDEALRMFGYEAAYASFDEHQKGTLEVGKLADLVVLGEDICTVDPHNIKDIPVLKTIVGGKVVYEAS